MQVFSRKENEQFQESVRKAEKCIDELMRALDFKYAVSKDLYLIDCYIYELQSVQMRYKFLLGRVKQIEDSYAKNPLEASGT